MITKDNIKKIDLLVIMIIFALVGISVLAIGSATKIHVGGSLTHVKKQVIFFIIGFVLMTIATLVDYHTIAAFHIPLYGVNIILLLIVLVNGDRKSVV